MIMFQRRLDTCDHTLQIKQQNEYRLEMHNILRKNGWTKLPKDSLWMHPDYGILHVLFALHLATKPKKRSFIWLKVAACLVYILFIIGTFLMVVLV